jgi:hypothetical protein
MHGEMVSSSRELDAPGATIKIIRATNGSIIEYAARREESEPTQALQSARNMVDRGPFERRLYIVPEGVKIADAVMAVLALMRLE